ncbi:MAG: hypothetical protein Kow0037_28430 [Calditrichia bacterium]
MLAIWKIFSGLLMSTILKPSFPQAKKARLLFIIKSFAPLIRYDFFRRFCRSVMSNKPKPFSSEK